MIQYFKHHAVPTRAMSFSKLILLSFQLLKFIWVSGDSYGHYRKSCDLCVLILLLFVIFYSFCKQCDLLVHISIIFYGAGQFFFFFFSKWESGSVFFCGIYIAIKN